MITYLKKLKLLNFIELGNFYYTKRYVYTNSSLKTLFENSNNSNFSSVFF